MEAQGQERRRSKRRVRVDSPQRGRCSLNLSVRREVAERIKALALLRRVDVSQLFEGWAEQECRGLVWYERTATPPPAGDHPPAES